MAEESARSRLGVPHENLSPVSAQISAWARETSIVLKKRAFGLPRREAPDPEGQISFSTTRDVGSKIVIKIDVGNEMDGMHCREGGLTLLGERVKPRAHVMPEERRLRDGHGDGGFLDSACTGERNRGGGFQRGQPLGETVASETVPRCLGS